MATQSEDTIPRETLQRADGDSEGEDDTTADYPNFPTTTPGLPALDPFHFPSNSEDVPAYLSNLSASRSAGSALPKRGLKDFEPHPTQLQASTLGTSRQAMQNALMHLRVHPLKTRSIGVFDERTGLTTVWRRKGSWLSTVGKDVAGGAVELRREEALWALERGSLDIRFRPKAYVSAEEDPQVEREGSMSKADAEDDDDAEVDQAGPQEEQGLPMSLQAAYATLVDSSKDAPGGSLTMEEYVVYGGLKRSGYIVLRARGTGRWQSRYPQTESPNSERDPRSKLTDSQAIQAGPWSRLASLLFPQTEAADSEPLRLRNGPLVKPGMYRSYQDIFRLIWQSIPPSEAPVPTDEANTRAQTLSPYTTTWHIYKPTQTRPFKKSDPGPPDFSICVVNARTTRLPTLSDLESLLNEQALDPPVDTTKEGRSGRSIGLTYGALKKGHRSVLLAVVDEGIISYMRVADAMFAQEGRLFDRATFGTVGGPGGKKGGGGRGRQKGKKS